MKRLLASVANSALALSGAAFAADAPTAVQKDQAPMAQGSTSATTSATTPAAPAKPSVEDSHAKKAGVAKKDKTSMKAPASRSVQLAQAPAPSTSAKPAGDDAQAKKPAVVKKSDDKKATTGTEPAQPSTTGKATTR